MLGSFAQSTTHSPLHASKSGDATWTGAIYVSDSGCQARIICVSSALPPDMQRSSWVVEDFDLLSVLYQGKVSTLLLASDRLSKRHLVLKAYRKDRLDALSRHQAEREIRIHIGLQHRHIIKLYAAFENAKYILMVMEHAGHGDLYSLLSSMGGRFEDEQLAVRDIIGPLCSAISYLHDRGIIHRDIKPENILLSSRGHLKLADFGLSINCYMEMPVTRAGTLDYMSPEVLICPGKLRPEDNKGRLDLAYTEQVDVWAVGVLTYELLVGNAPFESSSKAAVAKGILQLQPSFPATLPDPAQAFITAAMHKEASDRPSIWGLAAHPWIRSHRSLAAGCATATTSRTATATTSMPATATEARTATAMDIQAIAAAGADATYGPPAAAASNAACLPAANTTPQYEDPVDIGSLDPASLDPTYVRPHSLPPALSRAGTAVTCVAFNDPGAAAAGACQPSGMRFSTPAHGSNAAPSGRQEVCSGSGMPCESQAAAVAVRKAGPVSNDSSSSGASWYIGTGRDQQAPCLVQDPHQAPAPQLLPCQAAVVSAGWQQQQQQQAPCLAGIQAASQTPNQAAQHQQAASPKQRQPSPTSPKLRMLASVLGYLGVPRRYFGTSFRPASNSAAAVPGGTTHGPRCLSADVCAGTRSIDLNHGTDGAFQKDAASAPVGAAVRLHRKLPASSHAVASLGTSGTKQAAGSSSAAALQQRDNGRADERDFAQVHERVSMPLLVECGPAALTCGGVCVAAPLQQQGQEGRQAGNRHADFEFTSLSAPNHSQAL